MKQFNHFLNEVDIPEKDLDDLLMKTFSIVNDDIKNKLKYEKEKEQGNIHLDKCVKSISCKKYIIPKDSPQIGIPIILA